MGRTPPRGRRRSMHLLGRLWSWPPINLTSAQPLQRHSKEKREPDDGYSQRMMCRLGAAVVLRSACTPASVTMQARKFPSTA
jgi:hypothetical protein